MALSATEEGAQGPQRAQRAPQPSAGARRRGAECNILFSDLTVCVPRQFFVPCAYLTVQCIVLYICFPPSISFLAIIQVIMGVFTQAAPYS